MNLSKKIKKFFINLEKSRKTMKLLENRIAPEVFYAINDYAELISRTMETTELTNKEIFSSSMLIAYLLKGYLDRLELEQCLKISNATNF